MVSSFYKIATVDKINYHQYTSKKQDDQWAIQVELLLRKTDPKCFVASLSRELWCFSLNDDPVPTVPKPNNASTSTNHGSANGGNNEVMTPDKTGTFNSHYSKPNLPPHYAIFLKAFRRMIYINLTIESHHKLFPFGNSCIFLEEFKSKVLQVEPHLFENGDLTVSLSLKNLGISPLVLDNIDESYLRQNALYLLPSGTRAYLTSARMDACLTQPPDNSEALLKTLFVSHGIDLLYKKDIQWIKLIPHLGHFNGHIPKISSYIDNPNDSRTITWPLDLCFSQMTIGSEEENQKDRYSYNLDKAFDIIDNFIQLRQSSAYRTPGSSGVLSGSNPLSTEGAYTDQFQNFQRIQSVASNSSLQEYSIGSYKSKPASTDLGSGCLNEKKHLLSLEQFGMNELMPSEIGLDHLVEKKPYSAESTSSPLRNEKKAILSGVKSHNSSERPSSLSKESSQLEDESIDSVDDKELFGEDDDEDENLYGDTNKASNEHPLSKKVEQDEITEDMFGMSDDENGVKNSSTTEGDFFYKNIGPNSISPVKQSGTKRKYLDIPLDEITLSNSPLYMDPGAPLPVETPRDRRKSVFAPLNFNPIIENNVDNKYKNGGKFSFSPVSNEEALNFDISKNGLSTSEEDDSDMSDDLEYLDIKQEIKSVDNNLIEPQFTNQTIIQDIPEMVPSNLLRGDLLSANLNINTDINKEGFNSIWKIPQSDIPQNESPIRAIEPSISSNESNSKTNSEIFPKFPVFQDGQLSSGTKSPAGNTTDIALSGDELKSVSDNVQTTLEFSSNAVTSLPFLLRHIPLSSIPEVFSVFNPTVLLRNGNQRMLNLLCEQIVYDFDTLNNLNIPERNYTGITSCDTGLISETMAKLFSEFNRMNGSNIIKDFYPVTQPFVYVKKHHDIIKVRADSQAFSQYLNLKPSKGIKNFRFLMLTSSFRDDCANFVSSLSHTYIEYEFGFCELLKLNNEDTQGLIYLQDFKESKLLLLAAQIVSYCSTNKSSEKEIPILLILPLRSNRLCDLVEMTAKFEIIYNEVMSKIPNVQIFLKTVLMDFMTNPLTRIDEYYRLCVSVYSIVPDKSIKFTSIAPKHPEKIKFRTTQFSNGPAAIHYDAYIHLAYSRSVDKQWVFAAFSDSNGNDSLIKAWYVGSSKLKFDEACNEIWSIALKLASKKYGKICLILTRLNSILPDDELMNWRRLSGRNIYLAVVCVDDNEKISFFDKDTSYPSFKPFFKDSKLEHPIDAEELKNYEIRDIDQDIHIALFQNPFPLANSQHRCAIKSGALIKFREAEGNALCDKFEVNLLNCPHSDSTQLLQMILSEFRNLAALSTWYGISNGTSAHIPWHVLAVKKMMKTMVHINVIDSE